MLIVFSGGASGADDLWIKCAHEHHCDIQMMTFDGHKRTQSVPCQLNVISDEKLLEIKPLIISTCKILNRKLDERSFVYNLIARNYYIIKDAQVVYAVGYLNQTNGLGIDGGTAWGCEYFKSMGVIYFYDMCTSKWLQHTVDAWIECECVPSPLQFQRVALIGSRELTLNGKEAIRSVW